MCDSVGSEYWRDVLRTEIEAWRTGISRQEDTMLERLMLADKDSFTTENAHYTAKAGMLRFTMPGWGIMILYGKR